MQKISNFLKIAKNRGRDFPEGQLPNIANIFKKLLVLTKFNFSSLEAAMDASNRLRSSLELIGKLNPSGAGRVRSTFELTGKLNPSGA